jgi:hypothetical protein
MRLIAFITANILLTLSPVAHISREISPLESAVITVGSIHGGSKRNIISDSVRLQLTPFVPIRTRPASTCYAASRKSAMDSLAQPVYPRTCYRKWRSRTNIPHRY